MKLPITFPDDAQVIAEEAAYFRALSPEERVRSLDELFRLYHFLMASSGQPETLARLAREEEQRGRALIQDFVAHHG